VVIPRKKKKKGGSHVLGAGRLGWDSGDSGGMSAGLGSLRNEAWRRALLSAVGERRFGFGVCETGSF
jgi:hypothetical protein